MVHRALGPRGRHSLHDRVLHVPHVVHDVHGRGGPRHAALPRRVPQDHDHASGHPVRVRRPQRIPHNVRPRRHGVLRCDRHRIRRRRRTLRRIRVLQRAVHQPVHLSDHRPRARRYRNRVPHVREEDHRPRQVQQERPVLALQGAHQEMVVPRSVQPDFLEARIRSRQGRQLRRQAGHRRYRQRPVRCGRWRRRRRQQDADRRCPRLRFRGPSGRCSPVRPLRRHRDNPRRHAK